MRHIGDMLDPETLLVLLDPDVLLIRDIEPLLRHAEAGGVSALPMPWGLNEDTNGQTRASLSLMRAQWRPELGVSVIRCYGGECYVLSAASLRRVSLAVSSFWAWMLTSRDGIYGRRLTEEHVLSVVLDTLGLEVQDISPWARRIWTSYKRRNVRGDERGLRLWHLPAEKRYGFRRLFHEGARSSWFGGQNDEDFLRLVLRHTNIERSATRRAVEAGKRKLRICLDAAEALVANNEWQTPTN